jgi:gas vesicle protein
MSRDYDWDDDEPFVVIEKKSGGLGSFLLGIAVGAGIALLFAPQSGEETRRGLARSARRARRVARDAVGDVGQVVTDTFESARRQVEDRIDQARESIEIKRDQVHRAVHAGREAAAQARADLERRLAETKAAYNAGAQVARERSRLRADKA